MATWVTHLMVADRVLAALPALDRRGFCVGNIAPDCNVENEDWTAFTPSREVTHWMGGDRKVHADADRFYDEYLSPRRERIQSKEEMDFLLGYYAHLIVDAEFQRMIRDQARVRAVWQRIRADDALSARVAGQPETWDTVKKLIPRALRAREISAMEAEYLAQNPASGYLTEILPLQDFPDYIDYLPQGCIVRKIKVMGYLPQPGDCASIAISRQEYAAFVDGAVEQVTAKLEAHG